MTISTHMDPARQRDPHGIYLDDVNRAKAEIQRAKVEGREPDLKNPGTTTSDQVMPTQVAQSKVPGDHVVPVDFTSKIEIGHNPETAEGESADAAALQSESGLEPELPAKSSS